MPETMRCRACSAPVAQQDAFCPECGVHLEPAGEPLGVRPGSTAATRDGLDAVAAYAEYDSRKLTALTGYVAGFFGWPIGLHRLYAKRPGWWVYLILTILGVAGSPFFLVGFVFFGLEILGLAFDLGFMRRWVEKRNRRLRQEIFGPPVGTADALRPAEVAPAHGRPNARPRGYAGW
jgi:TM2 domain-containing membrane protein YozV